MYILIVGLGHQNGVRCRQVVAILEVAVCSGLTVSLILLTTFSKQKANVESLSS